MDIEITKDPFDFKRFRHQLIFDQNKLSNEDAQIFGGKVCSQINQVMKIKWHIETCVGNKCTIVSKRIMKKEKRVKWKGEIITVSDFPHIKR